MTPLTAPGITATSARTKSRPRLGANLVVGGILIGVVLLAALVSLFWTPYDPLPTHTEDRLLPPDGAHLLGTDPFGRDVVSLLMYGARVTMIVGLLSVLLALIVGVPLGLAAAMGSRRADTVVSRTVDVLLAFPALLFAIVLGAAFGAGMITTVIALGLGTAPAFARVARGAAMQVMSQEYIVAARASNRGVLYVAARHVLPNIASTLIVQASVVFALAVLSEASLSYLGFGTQPPTPSWGRMLQEGQQYIFSNPMLVVWPGIAIAIAVLGLNLLGDGLRDHLDPQMEATR